MYDLNIIQIWANNDFKDPFIVRRADWSMDFGLIVILLEVKKFPYGDAFGYSLPPLNGASPDPSWGTFEQPLNIKYRELCQWERVTELPHAWGICLDNEFKRREFYKIEIIRTASDNHSSLKITSREEGDPFFWMKKKGLIDSCYGDHPPEKRKYSPTLNLPE